MEGEKAMEIFKLVKAKGMLPAKLEDLIPLSFIGQAAVNFYRDKIKLIDKLNIPGMESQRKATLADGQDAGELLLDIETKIGESLPSVEDMDKKRSEQFKGIPRHGRLGIRQLPEGIDNTRAKQSRAISAHPKIVARVKAQAKKNEDIATKTAVLNQISYEKEKKSNALMKKNLEGIKAHVAIEQVQYLSKLDRVISILPIKPPENWDGKAFEMAKTKANIIIKRLEVFNG